MKHSCYEILGVADDASTAEIAAAYSARRDQLISISGEDAAKAQLTNLRECFAVLSDVNKRRRYDDQIAISAPLAASVHTSTQLPKPRKQAALEILSAIGVIPISIFVVGIGFYVAIKMIVADESKMPEEGKQTGPATVVCTGFVEQRLKSPGSADYPFGQRAVHNYGEVYTLMSYVDSHNAFGAVLRTQFRCGVEFMGGDIYDARNWKLLVLVMN